MQIIKRETFRKSQSMKLLGQWQEKVLWRSYKFQYELVILYFESENVSFQTELEKTPREFCQGLVFSEESQKKKSRVLSFPI